MFRKSILFVLLVLGMTTLACRFGQDIRIPQITVGPTETEQISVPVPAGDNTVMSLSFGAGELNVQPGAQNKLVEGTAKYNVRELKPVVTVEGSRVKIETGRFDKGFSLPNFGGNMVNTWDLKLGDAPMSLKVNAGAYSGNYDLGGLSLKTLEVSDGAADSRLDFSAPNLVEMSSLRYETGASTVKLIGLANANFAEMTFRSGAGDYTLNFSGNLKRDAYVKIESGISQVTIIVPKGVQARVKFDGGLSNVDLSGTWEKSGNTYANPGSGPTITIEVSMGAGNLRLDNQ
jgi:hypothetical protein